MIDPQTFLQIISPTPIITNGSYIKLTSKAFSFISKFYSFHCFYFKINNIKKTTGMNCSQTAYKTVLQKITCLHCPCSLRIIEKTKNPLSLTSSFNQLHLNYWQDSRILYNNTMYIHGHLCLWWLTAFQLLSYLHTHCKVSNGKGRFILLDFNYLQIILQLKAFKLI